MPDVGRKPPQVAYAEEYDDRRESVRKNTRVDARIDRSKPVSKPKRDAASDSGYSSVHSGATDRSGNQIVTLQKLPVRESIRSNITAIRRDSAQKDRPQSATRSQSTTRQCTDAAYVDPRCRSQENHDRRFTLPYHQAPPAQQQYYNTPAQPVGGAYPHPQQSHPMAVPVHAPPVLPGPAGPVLVSRRPSVSTRARPHSMYGSTSYAMPQMHGPPPSPSAYRQDVMYAQGAPQLGPLAVVGAGYGPGNYPLTTMPSPTSPTYIVPQAATSSAYSARRNDASYTATPAVAPSASRDRGLPRTMSARRASSRAAHADSIAYDSHESSSYTESDWDSGSDSDVSSSSQRQRARQVVRDRELMPPPSRPRMPERHTEPMTSHSKIGRSSLRRSVDFENAHSLRPEKIESERRRQPSRRRDSSYSSSGRHVLDATPSTGRTKATSLSSGTDPRRVAHARPRHHDDFDAQDVAEAYQRQTNGFIADELTAEKIREGRPGAPRVSHSRTSRHSISSMTSRTGGLTFEHNGTLFHVTNGTVNIGTGEDGTSTSIHIDGSNASNFDSSRSTTSRSGRDRARSSRRGFREEDGYEPAL